MSLSEHEKSVFRYKCKESLLWQTRYLFRERFGRKFIVNEHLEIIANVLERVIRGELTRVIFNIAPRYGKTELAVKNMVAHCLALNPSSKFIHLSYSDDLALDNSEEIKDIVLSDEYQELFPEVQIKKDSKAKKKWYTTEGGGVYATSASGQVTGFGAGRVDLEEEAGLDEFLTDIECKEGFGGAIIIDDPIKPDDADSTLKRDRINHKFDSTISNRVNSRKTPIIIIMQRLHPEDLSGYLIENDPDTWTVISLPVIKPDGSALWEFKHNIKELMKMRRLNPTVFERQYMQDPQPLEGLIWPKAELKTYDVLPEKRDLCLIISDPADEGIDHHSAPVLIVSEGIVYVEDVIFTQDNLTLVEPQLLAFDERFKPDMMFIESNNAGALFIRDVRQHTKTSIYAVNNTTNKVVRMLAQEGFVKENFRFKKEYNPHSPYGKFMKQIHNILRNGQEKKDDAPDSIACGAFILRRNYQYLFDKKEIE